MQGASYNDTDILNEHRMKQMVLSLSISYSHLQINERCIGKLMKLWEQKALKEIIGLIADSYRVPRSSIRIALGRKTTMTSAGQARAEVSVGFGGAKHELAHSQTPEQILAGDCDVFVYSIAHELAHVRLHTDNHEWRQSEVATDLLCLVLGFDGFYQAIHRKYPWGKIGYIPAAMTSSVFTEIDARTGILYI